MANDAGTTGSWTRAAGMIRTGTRWSAVMPGGRAVWRPYGPMGHGLPGYSAHAWSRRCARTPRAALRHAVEIPYRMADRMASLGERHRHRRGTTRALASATAIFLVRDAVVVTALAIDDEALSGLLVYLMTRIPT